MGSWRRNTELGLVLFAALITVGAYVLASFGRTADLPPNILPFLVVVVSLLLVAHIATRFLAKGADEVLLPVALLLNGLGYVFIARIREDLAGNQATWTLIGDRRLRRSRWSSCGACSDLARYKWTFALLGIGLLMLPFVPGVGRLRQRLAPLGAASGRSASSPASSPRSASPCSSPPTWWRSARCWPWPPGRSGRSACPSRATSGRSSSPGPSRW